MEMNDRVSISTGNGEARWNDRGSAVGGPISHESPVGDARCVVPFPSRPISIGNETAVVSFPMEMDHLQRRRNCGGFIPYGNETTGMEKRGRCFHFHLLNFHRK